jgi:hypothetical protein
MNAQDRRIIDAAIARYDALDLYESDYIRDATEVVSGQWNPDPSGELADLQGIDAYDLCWQVLDHDLDDRTIALMFAGAERLIETLREEDEAED